MMYTAFLVITLLGSSALALAEIPGLHNQTGCLYSYTEGGNYSIVMQDFEPQRGELKEAKYDNQKSSCTKVGDEGRLVFKFEPDDNYVRSLTFDFQIAQTRDSWLVDNVTLILDPVSQSFPKKEFSLKPVDVYAANYQSYSCKSLTLKSIGRGKDTPQITITLNRFQLQPFKELDNYVFAPSRDCSSWITLSVLMGLILVLFILFTTLIGIYLLAEQGNQSSDLKFSKQGGMLMNQAQLDATKLD